MGRKVSPEELAQDAALAEVAGTPWHTLDVPTVMSRLGTRESGLTAAEVAASRTRYGKNSTRDADKAGLLRRIWDQVNNVLIWILIASAGISGGFQDWPDFGLILGVVVLNVLIGVIQEGKAEAAADALKSLLAAKATVIRNGAQTSVNADEVVIGDVLNLAAGDAIAADVRLFQAAAMKVKESALTGESEDVEKMTAAISQPDAPVGDMKNCAFAGTTVSNGQGLGVVTAIGSRAVIGSIKKLVEEADAGETPLEHQLEVFGQVLSALTIVIAIGTFFLAWKARDLALHNAFAIAVSIAVAIIPEGLPSVVTITMAIGVRRMAEQNAIIRQLPAVETLGSVSVVCSDKTGTLTLNEMMVTRVRTSDQQFVVEGQGYDPYSGDVQGRVGSLRKNDRATMESLYWLMLPGVLANDGGLAAPADLAQARATPREEHAVVAVAGGPAMRPFAPGSSAVVAPEQESDASKRWQIAGDPTDVAVLVLGHKLGIEGNINAFKGRFETHDKIPFDSDYKFQAVLTDIETPNGPKRMVYLKGAWDEVIRRCGTQAVGTNAFVSEPCDHAFWLSEASGYAANGMRVLAVAQWEVPLSRNSVTLEEIRDDALKRPFLQLNGLIAILDPCRESAARAIASCHTAGVLVKMITGDHADTACYIARELGIITPDTFTEYLRVKDSDPDARRRIVLRGDEIKAIPSDEKESQLAKYVMDVNVFARVAPEHKLRIVRALKETHGRITSMTGDGVNDAPALKEAHVGVAMGITGTDVAKQAAKMILADDQFSTIAEAVRRGRGVYDNLRKVVIFALPTNMAQGFCIVAAMVIGLEAPLNALQVLTVNMVTSVTLGIVIALEEPEADVMRRPPRDPSAPLLDSFIAWRTFYVTLALVVAMLGNMQWELNQSHNPALGRSIAMSTLVVAQCLFALNCRFVFHSSLTHRVFMGNPWLLGAIVLNGLIQVFLVYTPGVQHVWEMDPMNGEQWGRVLLLSFAVFFLVEIEKALGPILYPYIKPILSAVGWIWRAITCNCVCVRCMTCRSSPQVAKPESVSSNKIVAVSDPTISATAPRADAAGVRSTSQSQVLSSRDSERLELEMRIATRVRSSRHIKAPPVAREVQQFVAESKQRLDLPVGVMHADGTVSAPVSARSTRGDGPHAEVAGPTVAAASRPHVPAHMMAILEEDDDARGVPSPISPAASITTPHSLVTLERASPDAAGDPVVAGSEITHVTVLGSAR